MAGRDRRINPVTGDYRPTGTGNYEYTETVETAGYHQLAGHRGLWWFDETKGSDVHLALQMNLSIATLQFLEDSVTGAFQALIDAGLARAQRVLVDQSARRVDRALLDATLVDQNADDIDLTEVGGTNVE